MPFSAFDQKFQVFTVFVKNRKTPTQPFFNFEHKSLDALQTFSLPSPYPLPTLSLSLPSPYPLPTLSLPSPYPLLTLSLPSPYPSLPSVYSLNYSRPVPFFSGHGASLPPTSAAALPNLRECRQQNSTPGWQLNSAPLFTCESGLSAYQRRTTNGKTPVRA